MLVVDRGFEGANEEYITLMAPKGKKKTKEKGKTRVAKQHTAKQACVNRTVTRVRNIIERMFSTGIKTWAVLGGKNLQFQYFEHIPAYMDIACAVSNAYRGCLDAQKGTHDEQDFLTMQERMEHKNEIQDLLQKSKSGRLSLKKGKFIRFEPQNECKVVPEMTEQDIRKYACGPYAMKLARPYVEFWNELETERKFFHYTTPQFVLIKASGLKSRYSPSLAREVYLLFKGSPRMLSDTLCTCHGGLRPIGGCAHAIAVLRLLGELTQRIAPQQPTKSEQLLKRALWYFQNNSSSDSDGESSESESSSDSSSSSN